MFSPPYRLRLLLGLVVLFGLQAKSGLATAPLEGVKPAHWRVTWTANPSRQATVSWSTAKAARKSYIRYRQRGTTTQVVTQAADTEKYIGGQTELYSNHVRLSNLEPSTAYEFEITSDGEKSPLMYFVTAPADDRPFSIFSGGDSRSNQKERRRANQFLAKMVNDSYTNDVTSDDIIALAHGGDYIQSGKSMEQWIEWLSDHELTKSEDGRLLPVIPARGNHDGGKIFNQVFGFPDDDQNYYAFDLGSQVRFVTLNTNISTAGDQATWLDKELESSRPNCRWLIAQYHRPAYPAVKAPSSALYGFVPLFDKHNLDLVCESDGHNIKRTVPIRDNIEDETGVVYIGEGGLGVAQRTPKATRWYLQPPGMSDSASHVYLLTFENKALTGRCHRLSGGLADEFTLLPRKVSLAKKSLADNGLNPLSPLMNVPGQTAFESDFEDPGKIARGNKNWQARQGTRWKVKGGVLRGQQSSPEYQAKKSDHRGLEPRIVSLKTPDQFIAKFSVRFLGGEETKLVPIVEFGHHNVRLKFSRTGILLLCDHEKVLLAESSDVKYQPGQWYHMLAEKNGDEFVVQFVGGPTLHGKHQSLTESTRSGVSALGIAGPRGGSVEIDNMTLWSIKPKNANGWLAVRDRLPKMEPKLLPKKTKRKKK